LLDSGGDLVVIDYDFKLGRSHLRGNGWRGLLALVLVLTLRAAIVGTIAISARPGGVWLVQLFEHLF
jgi:hypothetical protein